MIFSLGSCWAMHFAIESPPTPESNTPIAAALSVILGFNAW